ncbi:MAG: glycosyltransferase family 2 protein, partial [Anaerolineae bacterium]
MTHQPPELSVIVVTWNVRELLDRALTSLYACWGRRAGMEVIVVDNASSDGTAQMVSTQYPQARLLPNAENLGFAGGNNQGLATAEGKYLLLLNADTEVLDGALTELVGYLEQHPTVGLAGPHLLNPDGTTQSSRRRFPTLATLFLESTWLEGLAPRSVLARY